MRYFLLIFISLFAYAQRPPGSIEVDVEESNPDYYKSWFSNRVKETIGPGASPVITERDINSAIMEEFQNPSAAQDQLKILRERGVKIKMKLGYQKPEGECLERFEIETYEVITEESRRKFQKCRQDELNREGRLASTCSMSTPDVLPELRQGDKIIVHRREYEIQKDLEPFGPKFQVADTGWFYQFKWASPEQRKRYIAQCLSSVEGMPALKALNPTDAPQIKMDPGLYSDFQAWFAENEQLQKVESRDPRLISASNCLMKNSTQNFKNRTGNIAVLQKNKKNLYSIAIMDETSWRNLKKSESEKSISNQGIWPNLQSGSLSDLMGQVYGESLSINMYTCFISSGLQLLDPNSLIQSMNKSFPCQEKSLETITKAEGNRVSCEKGNAEMCLQIAKEKVEKKLSCLPDDQSSECLTSRLDLEQIYFQKACALGAKEGCLALDYLHQPVKPLTNDSIKKLKKACDTKTVPECYFWNRGMNPLNAQTLKSKVIECENEVNLACIDVGMMNIILKGSTEIGTSFLQKGCPWFMPHNDINSCLVATEIISKNGDPATSIKILKEMCKFKSDLACPKLYELYNQTEKDNLVKEVCGSKAPKCF